MLFSDRFKFLRERIFGFPKPAGREPFAGVIGVAAKTVEKWESKKQANIPNGDILRKILNACDAELNLSWLLTGKGEPYPGARAEHPQVCGQETPYIENAIVSITQEKPTANPPVDSYESEFKISESLTKAAKVLESRTSYATALHLNIVHFHRAILAESEIENLKNKCDEMEKENKDLKARIDRLEAAMEKLVAEQTAAQVNRKTGTNA